jgi:hypothetical protein
VSVGEVREREKMNNIDWSQAPAWVHWHAFDSDGRGGFHEQKPVVNRFRTFWLSYGYKWPSGYTLSTEQDWKDTLTERPKGE